MNLYTFDGCAVRRRIGFRVEYVFEGEPLLIVEPGVEEVDQLCDAVSSCFVDVDANDDEKEI